MMETVLFTDHDIIAFGRSRFCFATASNARRENRAVFGARLAAVSILFDQIDAALRQTVQNLARLVLRQLLFLHEEIGQCLGRKRSVGAG